MPLKQLLWLLPICLLHSVIFSQGTLIDDSFGDNGMVRPRFDRNPINSDLQIDKKNRIMFSVDTVLPGGDKAIILKRFNNEGQPDITFNGTGTLIINQSPNNSGPFDFEFVSSLFFLSNHKITFTVNSQSGEVWFRLNEDGTPDNQFGISGRRNLPEDFDFEMMAITSDDKFITVIPDFMEPTTLLLRRFTNEGNTDNSFGVNGLVEIDLISVGSAMMNVYDIQVDINNKIVISGQDDFGTTLCVLRFLQNGTIDPGFNTVGFLEYEGINSADEPYTFFGPQLSTDGKMLFWGADNMTSTAILRITSDGRPDAGFGTNGLLEFEYYQGKRYIVSAWPSAGNTTLIAGIEMTGNKYHYLIGKRKPNGDPDESFGESGFKSININNQDATGMFVKDLETGKLLVGGYGMEGKYRGPNFLRLEANGDRDLSFGNNGQLFLSGVEKSNFSEESGTTTILAHLTTTPDQSILLTGVYKDGGLTDHSIYIQKLTPDGLPDTGFGESSWTTVTPLGGVIEGNQFIQLGADGKIAIQPNEKIIIAYSVFDIFSGNLIMVQRLNANGLPDNSFGTGGRTLIHPSELPYEDFSINDLKVAPDGKIALTVQFEDFNDGLFKTPIFQLTESGLPDNSFNSNGQLTPEFRVTNLVFSAENRLLALGYTNIDPNDCCQGLTLRRYTQNGSKDNNFNGGAAISIKYSDEEDIPVSVLTEPGTDAVTVLFSPFNSNKQYGIAKFTATGTPILDWGDQGILTGTGVNFPQYWIEGVRMQDGGYLFAGPDEFEQNLLNILKINANGQPDNGFSGNGVEIINYEPALYYNMAGLALQSGGKIIAGGNETKNSGGINMKLQDNAVITRVHSVPPVIYTLIQQGNWSNPANWQGGQVPPAVIPPGMQIVINPGGNGEATLDINITVQDGGKIIVKPGKKLNVVAHLTVPSITVM